MPLDEAAEKATVEPSSEMVVEESLMNELAEPTRPVETAPHDIEEAEQEIDDEVAEAEAAEEALYQYSPLARAWLMISILLTLAIAVVSGIRTDSALIFAVIGFLPTIACCLIFIVLLEGGFKDILFWMTPLGICLLWLAIGDFLNTSLNNQLDVALLTGVNIIISYIILAIMTAIEYAHKRDEEDVSLEEDFKPEKLDRYIHTIEDRCKGINFVIGRVYRDSRGGSKAIRERLKVPSEWYNEFNSISASQIREKRPLALEILGKIERQLQVLLKPEKDVFTHSEIKALRIAHDTNGYDRIIDVLSVNDRDPVEDYFLGAMDFCKKVTEGLRRQQ